MSETLNTGEVVKETTTATVKLDDVLGNKEIMEGVMKSEVVTKYIQGEIDKVRTKASQEKASKESEFSIYKAETDKKIEELTAFQKNYFKTEALKKIGLDIELWDYVKGDTEEEIKKSAESLKKIISKKAETAIGGNIKTNTSYKGITAEQFGKMTYTEKAELYQNNKELYEELSK